MKLKVIIPNSGMSTETLREREIMLRKFALADTEISVDCIDGGPESIESGYDELLAGPYVIDKVLAAEKAGYNAILIYCGSDPAVEAARELVDIPVIGPGKVSMLIVNDLSYKFSILTVLDSTVARDEEHYRRMGLDSTRLASVRSIGIPVSNVRDQMDQTIQALAESGRKAIEQDGAQAIVLSCLGMAGMGAKLQKILKVPVIDQAVVAVKYCELVVSSGLNYSSLSYPVPPDKIRI